MRVKTYYPERIQLRVPAGVTVAVEAAAAEANSSPHEFLRRVCLSALEAEGVKLPKMQPAGAGA